jgi:signal peptidase
MEPELSVGDVILSKKINANTLEIGDIISYNGTEGDYANKIITHKIINIDESGGERVFTTMGIANDTADPPVYESQVLGKMVYKVPIIGTLYSFFMTIYGLIAVILIILLAFSNEIITLFKLAKEKVHRDVTREFEEQNGTSILTDHENEEEENKTE